MPYIKISDPNIIDLAAWHQVINVINQHSDSITAITNNFGIQGSGETEWNGEADIVHEYNPGSQKIIYGKTKIESANVFKDDVEHMYYETIDFESNVSGTGGFSAKPIVVATPTFGSQADPPPDTRANVICSVIAVTDEKFVVRMIRATSTGSEPLPVFTTDTQYFYISWMAIGPK
jgi:hypothetical protein